MAPVLASLVDPAHTALVTSECQRGVVGDLAALPELAAAAADLGVLDACGRLAAAARASDVAVVHCVAHRRTDGRGSNANARVFMAMRSQATLEPGSPEVEVVPELGTAPSDLVLARLHGVGPMAGTDLDPVLRNLGVTTMVAVGVSLNVALLALAFDAVSAGYQVVVPADAVVGVPVDYGRAVLEHTVGLVATVTTSHDVVEVWGR